MYLSKIEIENFRCFGSGAGRFELTLGPGLTALVGENDSGKTAVIDAIRFALGTTDQEWYRLEAADFHESAAARDIRIHLAFAGLSDPEKSAFVEYLTYGEGNGVPVLHVYWTAQDTGEERNGRPYRKVEVRSGKHGDGPNLAQEVRELLRATYLRPLRDAEGALSAGRGSRLSDIFHQDRRIKEGADFGPARSLDELDVEALKALSVLGIGDLANRLLQEQRGVAGTRDKIDKHLAKLTLEGEPVSSAVRVSGVEAKPDLRLRQLLEKLDLSLSGEGRMGLGSNNLLFIACELLLLVEEGPRMKLLLVEEPEAHLHAQRQMRVMQYMQRRASREGVQIIVSTHSPLLASAIALENLVIIHGSRGYSLAPERTNLSGDDYRFLARFLDATKANLFFAKAVIVVEGDGENIILPTLAELLGRDFTANGVSVVNVGGVGLRRYARIFQRKALPDGTATASLDIPVACLADMDVHPDCARGIIAGDRRWTIKSQTDLEARRRRISERADGQSVRTFVSDEWTLEYDLAIGPKDARGNFSGGLARDVYVAARLAEEDDAIISGVQTVAALEVIAAEEFVGLEAEAAAVDGSTRAEALATRIYAKFLVARVSKAVFAQYFSELLRRRRKDGSLTPEELRTRLPSYLTAAIDYVAPRVVQPDTDAAPAAPAPPAA